MLEFYITIFLTILILYSLIYHFTKPRIIEGATGEYQNYPDDPLILAKTNAANIDVLKKKMDEITTLSKQQKVNTDDIDKNSQTIASLLKSMSPSSEEASQHNQSIMDEE